MEVYLSETTFIRLHQGLREKQELPSHYLQINPGLTETKRSSMCFFTMSWILLDANTHLQKNISSNLVLVELSILSFKILLRVSKVLLSLLIV